MDFIVGLVSGLISLIALIVFFVMAAALGNISKNLKNINRILMTLEKGKEEPSEPIKAKTFEKPANTVTFRNKSTKAIETVSLEYWNDLIKSYGEDKYEVIE